MLAVENQEMQQAIIGKVCRMLYFRIITTASTIINIKTKHDGYKTVKGYHLLQLKIFYLSLLSTCI